MPTCTEAEWALIEIALKPMTEGETHLGIEHALKERARIEAAVLAERLSPALKERAIRARRALLVASKEHEAVWGELRKAGFEGRFRVPPLWDDITAEAERRIEQGQ